MCLHRVNLCAFSMDGLIGKDFMNYFWGFNRTVKRNAQTFSASEITRKFT